MEIKRQLQNDKVIFLAFQLQMFPTIINYKTMVSDQNITYRHHTLKVRWLLPPATALIPCSYTMGNWWIIWMFWNTAGGRNLAPAGRLAKSRYNPILYTVSWLLVVSNWCRVFHPHYLPSIFPLFTLPSQFAIDSNYSIEIPHILYNIYTADRIFKKHWTTDRIGQNAISKSNR